MEHPSKVSFERECEPKLAPLPLPASITSRIIKTSPVGLDFHILESGQPAQSKDLHPPRPLIILLHGFPELAYSWKSVLPLLSDAGYHAVAVDQRGYGRTTGWDTRPYEEVDLSTFAVSVLARDIVTLVHALGHREVKCIVGHDFGAVPAAACALIRPDMFKSVVLLSHPFRGVPSFPFGQDDSNSAHASHDVHAELASLGLKHYRWYFASHSAACDMQQPLPSLKEFLRGYFHLKSADWDGNDPHPLVEWSASELAKMPKYYIMPLDSNMREAVASDMENEDLATVAERSARWLPESVLDVYVSEYTRTGYQGGLNWYRMATDPQNTQDMLLFAGKKLEVPCLFLGGAKDWATYQEPGVIEKMDEVCLQFRGVRLIPSAGHWAPKEAPEEVAGGIIEFVKSVGS